MIPQWIASLLVKPVIDGVIGGYKAKLEAGNTTERLAAELAAKELEVTKREAELQAQIIGVEQGSWWTSFPRPMLALPFIIFVWKIVVWDKVLGWGTTDDLSPVMWNSFTIILTAYFGGRSLEKVAQIFKR